MYPVKLTVEVTEEEAQTIRQAAQRRGLSVSRYLAILSVCEESPLIDEMRKAAFEGAKDALDLYEDVRPAVYDTRQTAHYLNISVRKLDELVAARELRPLRIGRKRLFPVAQLDGFLRSLCR